MRLFGFTRARAAAQVDRIGLALPRGVEDHREERLAVVAGQVRAVGRPHHGMAEAIGGAIELDRHERDLRAVVLAAAVQDFLRQLPADEERQELVNDHPVVMQSGEPACLFEDLFRVHARVALVEVIDGLVVEEQESGVQAGDDDVLVVARVDDDRRVVALARQVLVQAAALDPELDAGVELRREPRPAAIDGIEIEGGRTRVR